LFGQKKITKICILCKANYCRSPVAEKIIRANLPNDIFIESAGLIDFFKLSMDERSKKYLEEKGYIDLDHKTKRINTDLFNHNDLIVAMDLNLVNSLKEKFPRYSNKIFLLPVLIHSTAIQDPINFKEEEYFKCMDLLEEACLKFCEKIGENNNVLK